MTPNPCPNATNHTPRPAGYAAWHEWAERMSRTHEQQRCPDCGRWAVWAKRSGISGELIDKQETRQ
jgi:hypothetical protein